MKYDFDLIKEKAETARINYRIGLISREEAKFDILPYLSILNSKSKEIARKYNQKHRDVSFTEYVR